MLNIRKKYEQKNQAISEKVGRVNDQVELGSDIQKMEDRTDTVKKLIVDLQEKTEKYIQPDGKLRHKHHHSPRIERHSLPASPKKSLSETMTSYGRQLDEIQDTRTEFTSGDSKYLGKSLVEFGDSLEQIFDQKNALESGVRQNFLEPLNHILTKDISEVAFHRKKLEKRRLDCSYK